MPKGASGHQGSLPPHLSLRLLSAAAEVRPLPNHCNVSDRLMAVIRLVSSRSPQNVDRQERGILRADRAYKPRRAHSELVPIMVGINIEDRRNSGFFQSVMRT